MYEDFGFTVGSKLLTYMDGDSRGFHFNQIPLLSVCMEMTNCVRSAGLAVVLSFAADLPGGRLTANATLKALIARAYGVKEYEIDGGPNWLSQDYFTIEARAAADATTEQFNEMLKALLANRFGLRAHGATRLGRLYSLVLARADGKLAPGLKPTSAECVAEIEERKRLVAAGTPPATPATPRRSSPGQTGLPELAPRCGVVMMRGSSSSTAIVAGGQSLTFLINRLSSDVGSAVIDRTGLEGLFDVTVEFEAPQQLTRGLSAAGGLDLNSTESPKPPLRIAIQDQLGLKLESVEGQVPILVIDEAKKPTPD
jgi:uncharacterized protein (TIGR03435 family)